MSKLKLLLSVVLVGVLVAITYFLFEYAVSHSVTYVWDTTFNTADKRLLVVPLGVILAIVYFGMQKLIDPDSEKHESHGLGGNTIPPTFKSLGVILLLGYLSLLAGASLGPEAVLVPACVVIGSLAGARLFKKDQAAAKTLAAAGIIALMAAFFHSFIIGLLSIFLVKKQTKVAITPLLVVVAAIASASSAVTLHYIDPSNRYFNFPHITWKVALADIAVGIILIVAGYCATFVLKYVHGGFTRIKTRLKSLAWWQLALVASVGLTLLYLIGGTLVQFTGNESIAPLLAQAPGLGFMSVLGVFIIKILAIAWSKVMGYRGGLVFPMIFVASSLVALTQFVIHDASFGVGLLAALAGILLAEKKAKILF